MVKFKTQVIVFLVLITGITAFKSQGLKDYNDLVNLSESAIITKDYEKALLSYEQLKNQNYLFSRDIYNAMICANKTKNWKEVNYWAKKFILKGAELSFFNQYHFKEYRTTPFWKELSAQKIKNSLKRKLIQSLDSLRSVDQERFVKLKSDHNTKVYNLTEIDKKLFELEKKYGKITEESAGINIENDTIYRFFPKYAVLYRHSFQSHKTASYFNEKVKNNELERMLYYNTKDYNMMPIVEQSNKLYYLKEDLLSDDTREDFLKFEKITRTAYKNKDFANFSFYYPISRIESFADSESEENFKTMLKELYNQ